jgi:PAS domain S-box-containing protein
MRKRHIPFYLLLLAIAVAPVLIDVGLKTLLPDQYWKNEPLHSAIEAVGALIAIFMASILLLKQNEETEGKIYWLSLGFLSMGILDGFHAISKPGDSFVLLHSLGSFFGGFWFVLNWFPAFIENLYKKTSAFWIVIAGSLLCGTWIFLLPDTFPTMIHNGEFTTTAIAINIITGTMFLVAAFRFILDYYHFKTAETCMFACMFLLFGIAEILFYNSSIWDGGWWWWHLLRLIAYILILLFIIRQYIIILAMQKESEEQYRILTHSSLTGIYIHIGGTIKFVNDFFAKMLGYNPEEMVGKTYWDFVHPDDRDMVSNISLARARGENVVAQYEFRHINVDGMTVWVRNMATIIQFAGQPANMGNLVDITERKQTEEALQESAQYHQELFTNSPTALFLQDFSSAETCVEKLKLKGVGDLNTYFQNNPDEVSKLAKSVVISQVNKAAINLYESKTSDNLLQNLDQVLIKSDWQDFINQVLSFTRGIDWYDGETRNRTLKGKTINLIVRKIVINRDKNGLSKILVALTDVSELLKAYQDKEEMASQLQQSQKMKSIGTLAGGIAHDFNNILFPVVGHTEMLLEDVPANSPFREGLSQIYAGAMRASELVKQILTFSRQKDGELKLMKMQPIIKEALKLIRSTIPTTIEIKQNIQSDCGAIKGDPTQIHQILMNLATNAYHAMEETGGKLNVRLKKVELEEPDLFDPGIKSGTYACLSISDTGKGMDNKLIEKIFDPFFTTKETGKGTGMGLSVVHGIVKGMHGTIKVYSEPDKGTEFHVYLPLAEAVKEQQVIHTTTVIQGGTEHILLVDDEKSIIAMEQNMLERLGYKVTSRSSSIEALEAFRAAPDKFDMIITDMAMPKMTGDKLSVELNKILPGIPVLLCTGFSETMSEEKAKSLGINGFLLKPIVMKDLSHKIREVLDKK